MDNGYISGFFTINNLKGFLYWIIPLTAYMTSMYLIAFSRESFVSMIFIMSLMLHPIGAVPIAYLIDTLKQGLEELVFKRIGTLNTNGPFRKWLGRLFTFTTVSYLAFVILIQYHLFCIWIKYRNAYTDYGVPVASLNGFKNKPFNQCCEDCEIIEEKDSILNYLTKLSSDQKAYVLLGSFLSLMCFHFVESLLSTCKPPKSLIDFYIAKEDEIKDVKISYLKIGVKENISQTKTKIWNFGMRRFEIRQETLIKIVMLGFAIVFLFLVLCTSLVFPYVIKSACLQKLQDLGKYMKTSGKNNLLCSFHLNIFRQLELFD